MKVTKVFLILISSYAASSASLNDDAGGLQDGLYPEATGRLTRDVGAMRRAQTARFICRDELKRRRLEGQNSGDFSTRFQAEDAPDATVDDPAPSKYGLTSGVLQHGTNLLRYLLSTMGIHLG